MRRRTSKRVKSVVQGKVCKSVEDTSCSIDLVLDLQVLYALENNLLAVRGELLSEIGIDRCRESMLDTESPPIILSSVMSHDREVDEMIQEGKRWRRLEVSLQILNWSESAELGIIAIPFVRWQ